MGWGRQNHPFLPRSRKARFWEDIVGANYLEGSIGTIGIAPMAQSEDIN